MVKDIAPTDSRYRPDQRALEQGDIRLAGNEKIRLEEKQRAARKILEQNSQTHQPRWFKFENGEWQFKGEYWECKERGYFDNIPDIY